MLWAPLNKAPVSKGFRQFLQQDWWQPPDAGADAESHSVNTSQYMSDGAAHRSHACRCTKRYPADVCVHSHAGGHTENLGLLPVLQKRCSRIVCLDASADPTELCGSLIGVMDQARRYGRFCWCPLTFTPSPADPESCYGRCRYFGCQFAPPSHFQDAYTDVNMYVQDQLLVAKPQAFHLRITYIATESEPASEGQLLYLKPRYARKTPAMNTRAPPPRPPGMADAGPCCNQDHTAPETGTERAKRVYRAVKSKLESTGGEGHDGPQRVTNDVQAWTYAMQRHYEASHGVSVADAELLDEDEDMVGCCCDCCSSRSSCCRCTTKLGKYPHVSTANQFLTKRQRRAFHRLGYGMMTAAWYNHAAFFESLLGDNVYA